MRIVVKWIFSRVLACAGWAGFQPTGFLQPASVWVLQRRSKVSMLAPPLGRLEPVPWARRGRRSSVLTPTHFSSTQLICVNPSGPCSNQGLPTSLPDFVLTLQTSLSVTCALDMSPPSGGWGGTAVRPCLLLSCGGCGSGAS